MAEPAKTAAITDVSLATKKRWGSRLGVTTVYVTHDQEEAMVLSDRVAIMNQGRVQQVGAPAEVYNRPVNRFVAQFLGAANLLPAKVLASNGRDPGRALLAGIEVPFTAGRPMAAGTSIELFLRPECVVLHGDHATPLRGVVETAIFVGESTRFRIRVGTDTVIDVTSHNQTGGPAHSPGDWVSMSWAPGTAVALA